MGRTDWQNIMGIFHPPIMLVLFYIEYLTLLSLGGHNVPIKDLKNTIFLEPIVRIDLKPYPIGPLRDRGRPFLIMGPSNQPHRVHLRFIFGPRKV